MSLLGRSELRGLTRLVFLQGSRKSRKHHNQHLPLTQPYEKMASFDVNRLHGLFIKEVNSFPIVRLKDCCRTLPQLLINVPRL